MNRHPFDNQRCQAPAKAKRMSCRLAMPQIPSKNAARLAYFGAEKGT